MNVVVAPVIDIKYVQIGPDELEAVRDTLVTADLSGNADVVGHYEQELASWFGARFAVACSSGTAAIHLALLALGVGPGAEVIVPATAPTMTALPVIAVGAVPVFADVAHPATLRSRSSRRGGQAHATHQSGDRGSDVGLPGRRA